MPHVNKIDEVIRLLEAGANIVSTRMEYQNPAGLGQAERAWIVDACRRGNASIHASGSSPGFITEAMPIVLTSISRRLDRLTISEFADSSSRNSPEMLFGPMMGFASPPGNMNQAMLDHMKHSFSPSLGLIAEALGLPFDDIQVRSAQGVARKDTQIAAGLVPAGTVAATRTVVSGMHKGKPLINFEAIWYVSADVDTTDGEEWTFRDSGWRVLVEGDTPLEVTIRFPVPEERYADFTPNLTAHRPVNCIPYVCAAEPGFVTTLDLPQVVARLG
jgi:4-hydroxy-tetrahydrodipicolinate reductase